jgi:hypothetical protein
MVKVVAGIPVVSDSSTETVDSCPASNISQVVVQKIHKHWLVAAYLMILVILSFARRGEFLTLACFNFFTMI